VDGDKKRGFSKLVVVGDESTIAVSIIVFNESYELITSVRGKSSGFQCELT